MRRLDRYSKKTKKKPTHPHQTHTPRRGRSVLPHSECFALRAYSSHFLLLQWLPPQPLLHQHPPPYLVGAEGNYVGLFPPPNPLTRFKSDAATPRICPRCIFIGYCGLIGFLLVTPPSFFDDALLSSPHKPYQLSPHVTRVVR